MVAGGNETKNQSVVAVRKEALTFFFPSHKHRINLQEAKKKKKKEKNEPVNIRFVYTNFNAQANKSKT